MTDAPVRSAVVDLAFDVQGTTIPRHHRAALADAIAAAVPGWHRIAGTGIHRLNTSSGAGPEALLSRRTRLVLRVPRAQVDVVAAALPGRAITLGDATLRVGRPQVRELLPWGTIYAHLVAADAADEAAFLSSVRCRLDAMNVGGRAICGRHQQVDGGEVCGYSLMVDGMEPAASLRLMEQGLGAHRQWGCGVFVPHKSAAAVGSAH